jgi:thioredoxin reductase
LHTALVTKDIGGMANLAEKIENYPGYEGSGFDLMQKFWKQAKKFGAESLSSETAHLKKDKTGFIVTLKNGKVIHSKTLIVALGTEKRKMNLPGEKKFSGKGISYCATCDAMFFKGKEVAVVGGSNSAAKAALILSGIAKKVYIVYRKAELRSDKIEKEKLKKKKNVEIIYNSVPKAIKGSKFVEAFDIENGGKVRTLKVQGIFVEIGAIPISSIIQELNVATDPRGFTIANEDLMTNIKGVFAAGDNVEGKLKQVVVAAAQGAIAAKGVSDYLSKK